MNKKEMLLILAKDLEEYLQRGFRFHPVFMEEFGRLLRNASGHEKEIFFTACKAIKFCESVAKTSIYS